MELWEIISKYGSTDRQFYNDLKKANPQHSKQITQAVKGQKKGSTHILRLDSYPAIFIIGKRGEGKSVLLEWLLVFYYFRNYVILDWNCAFDLESLQWCVKDPDRADSVAFPILVIIPRSEWFKTDGRMIPHPKHPDKMVEAIKFVYDDTPLHKIIMQAYEEERVCIFSIYLYPSIAEGQRKIAQFLGAKGLPEAVRDHLPTSVKCVLGFRELKDLSSSRMLTHGGTGERESKRSLNFIAAQARHARTILAADMQSTKQVQEAMFDQEDYVFVKRMVKRHIPDWLQWLDKEITSKVKWALKHYMRDKLGVVTIDRLSKNAFICIHPEGTYTYEHNGLPLFKHHAEGDDAQKLAGIIDKGRYSKDELKVDPILKLQAEQKRAEEDKELITSLQDCLVMHEREGMSWKEIQANKRIKDDKNKLMAPDAVGRKVMRYWKDYKLINLPVDDKPSDEQPPMPG